MSGEASCFRAGSVQEHLAFGPAIGFRARRRIGDNTVRAGQWRAVDALANGPLFRAPDVEPEPSFPVEVW